MPPFKPTVDNFKNIPVGETDMDLDVRTLKMPGASVVNYDDHIPKEQEPIIHKLHPVPKPKEHERPAVVEQPRVVEQPKKVQNIMDDDIFGSVVNVPVVQPPQPSPQAPKQDIFDMGLGGVSFENTPPQPKPVNNDPFNILGLEMGGGSAPAQTPPPNNGGFGGDLLGFGLSGPSNPQPAVTQPANNLLGGADLMGFGFAPNPSAPVAVNQGGFNFGQPTPPPQPQANNFGFNLLGGSQPTQQVPQPVSIPPHNTSGFQPIANNNPNKILAYDNAHLQIWIDCIK